MTVQQMKEMMEQLANIGNQLKRLVDLAEKEVQIKKTKEGR